MDELTVMPIAENQSYATYQNVRMQGRLNATDQKAENCAMRSWKCPKGNGDAERGRGRRVCLYA